MKRGDLFDRVIPWLPYAALIVVAIFSLRRLDDFDTWFHLASGRWIAQHLAIPYKDVLSFTVPDHEWRDLSWLYDLLLYAIRGLAGASGLVIASAVCYVAAFALLARHLSRHLGPVASAVVLLWVAATVNERFLIRPEMASFPLLAAVQLVLAGGRSHPERLRWLVPLMILWVNMHPLFILGAVCIAAAIGGAFLAETSILPRGWRDDSAWPAASRAALQTWGVAAIAATLVNPYLVRGVLLPFDLKKLIDGSNGAYLAIGEYRPPFSGYFPTFALGSYQALFIALAALVAIAGWLRAGGGPELPDEDDSRFDIGAVAFAVALAWLSLLARRNIGIFAIGVVPVLGAALSNVLDSLPESWIERSERAGRVVAALVLVAALAIGSLGATNGWYARTRETHELGLGVFEPNFPARAAQFFREQKLPGPTYTDMTAGSYLTWGDPTGKGVYIDGRLEVYGTPFYVDYLSHFDDIKAWKRDVDARGIQTAMIFHRWEVCQSLIRAIDATGEWFLVYYDETAVIFVRGGVANVGAIDAARAAFTNTWLARNDAALTGPRRTFPWQWSIARATGQISYARALELIGDTKEALIWFQVAIEGGLPAQAEVDARRHAADCLVALGEPAQARVHLVRALELEPGSELTQDMLRRLDEPSP